MQLCAAGSHPPKEQVRARARMRFSARFMRQKPHGPRSRDARFCPDAVEHVVQQLGGNSTFWSTTPPSSCMRTPLPT